jgi:hypothetical protein
MLIEANRRRRADSAQKAGLPDAAVTLVDQRRTTGRGHPADRSVVIMSAGSERAELDLSFAFPEVDQTPDVIPCAGGIC